MRQQPQKSNDPFDILGLDIGGNTGPAKTNNNGGDLLGGLGGFNFGTQPTQQPFMQPQPQPVQNKGGFDSLLDDGLLGGGVTKPPTQTFTPQQPPQQVNLGFDFLGTGSVTTTTPPPVNQTPNFLGQQTNFLGQPTQPVQPVQPVQPQGQNTFKFKAYETPHV